MRQYLVFDLDASTGFFGRSFTFRNHGRDLLPDEAHDVVKHARVVRVHPRLFVLCGREQLLRRIVMGQHSVHTADAQGVACVDRNDPGMWVRRAQELDVKQAFDLGVERIALHATHHLRPGRSRQAAAEGFARTDLLDIVLAIERVLDRTIAGTAADVTLE